MRPRGGNPRDMTGAVGAVAEERGASRAQIALAWLRSNPVVVAPLVGASNRSHIDDAAASLDIELTSDEIARLEQHYTPRHDFQGISDDAELQRIMARLPQFATVMPARVPPGPGPGTAVHAT